MEFIRLILVTLLIHRSHELAVPHQNHLKFSGKVFFYGSEMESPDNNLCAVGEVKNADGICNPSSGESNRNWSFYAAATKNSESTKTTLRPKMKYDIVVIHPKEKKQEDPIIIPPPSEKNVVVVVRKGPKEKTPKIIEVSTYPPLSPEVHFIDYKEGSNMLLPGGIDLKSALAGAPFVANRIKSGLEVAIPTSYKPWHKTKGSDGAQKIFPSEDARMKANFERFVRSNMEKNADKSFKDVVYDYILAANLSESDPEIEQEHPDTGDDVTEKTVYTTIQVMEEELKASSLDGLPKEIVIDTNNIKNRETKFKENNAAIMETTAMTPHNVIENKEAKKGSTIENFTKLPPETKNFLGEPLTREFSSNWKGITRSLQEPSELSTENSVRPFGTVRTIISTTPILKKFDSVNQVIVPNHSSALATKVGSNQLNKKINLRSSLIPDVERIKFDKARLEENLPVKSDKIVPEIETFFKELLKGANPALDTKKFDYIIKEMSKIVAESTIFKTQLEKLKKDEPAFNLSDHSLEENNANGQNFKSSSESTKLDHKLKIPNWQEPKMAQISSNSTKPKQNIHAIKDSKVNLSNNNKRKGVVNKAEKDDSLIIPKYSKTRPSSQQIDSSYNRFISSYMNLYPNSKASNDNSDKDSTTEVKEFVGKVGSISKAFADGWRGMEFTIGNPVRSEQEKTDLYSEHNAAKSKKTHSQILNTQKDENYNKSSLRVKKFKENNHLDSKPVITSNSLGLESGDIRKPTAIEDGRSYSTNNYGSSHNMYDSSLEKKGNFYEGRNSTINGNRGQSSIIGTVKGETEKTKGIIEFGSGTQSNINFRLKSSYLEKEQPKIITTGDIIYGKQMESGPKIRTSDQISKLDKTKEIKAKLHENDFNNNTYVKTKVSHERNIEDENGLKYIIEKIMAAKPFESGHKIVPELEQILSAQNEDVLKNVHDKKEVETTTEATVGKTTVRHEKTSTEAQQPFQQFHKMVTITLGINISDPHAKKGEKYETNKGININPQTPKIRSIDDKEVVNPLNTATLKSTLTNQLQNNPLFKNLKKEINTKPEINLNNSRINKDEKSVRNATKFTLEEVRSNPYSSPIYRNHTNEFEWKPLDRLANDTDAQFIASHGKNQEPFLLLNVDNKTPSGSEEKRLTSKNGRLNNASKSNKVIDEAPLVRDAQSSRFKVDSKPLILSKETNRDSNTKGPQNVEPLTGRPWLRVAIHV